MANIIRLGGGYQAGYDDGNTDGYSKGHTDGYNSGYSKGNTDGYNSAKNQFVATYLGTGTSFDVKSKFPNEYGSFTADNFICEATGNVSKRGGAGNSHGAGSIYLNCHIYVNKSYNASTGILTASVHADSATASFQNGSVPAIGAELGVKAYFVRSTQ